MIENKNIADEWNTVNKMATKRAYLAATLSATAVSQMFTQDLEENVDALTVEVHVDEQKTAPVKARMSDEDKAKSEKAKAKFAEIKSFAENYKIDIDQFSDVLKSIKVEWKKLNWDGVFTSFRILENRIADIVEQKDREKERSV